PLWQDNPSGGQFLVFTRGTPLGKPIRMTSGGLPEWIPSPVYAQQPVPASVFDPTRRDEDLMGDLARGQKEALGPLYGSYASLVFQLCAQSLDRAAAEE